MSKSFGVGWGCYACFVELAFKVFDLFAKTENLRYCLVFWDLISTDPANSKYPPAEPGALVVSRSKRPVERGRCAAT